MFIGICGGICSGKSTVARYLVEHHGFKQLSLKEDSNGVKSADDSGEPDKLVQNHSSGTETDRLLEEICTHNEMMANGISKPTQSANSESDQYVFDSAQDLKDFVTKRWQERWVTTNIYNEQILNSYVKRPFFILVSIDAPVSIRWKRFQSLYLSPPTTPIHSPSSSPPPIKRQMHPKVTTLEDFLNLSDHHLYSPTTGLLPLISRATIRLINTSTSLAHLYATLGRLDLTNPTRFRPCWDQYFMTLATLASHRSNCMKRRVGCVLIRHNRVIATGYNGTPRNITNCIEGGCPRCKSGARSGTGLGTCLCIHAEENAMLEAGRERVGDGAVLYCDTCPCLTCSIKIVQVGIAEVVYFEGYSMDMETAAVFKEAGVKLRQFSPPANGMIHLENHA